MFGLGSSSQLGIGIAISLNNKFSGQAAQVGREMQQLKKSSEALASSAIRDYRNSATAVSGAAAGVAVGMFALTDKFSEFQHKVNQVYIVGGRQLGKTREQLESFSRDLSQQFTRNPQEIAGAMFENVKAGVTSGIEQITRYQIAVASATDEMLDGEEGVAAKLLGITNAMGIPLSRFADVANATTAAANASMSSVRSIGESMEYAAFTAHTFNIPLEQTLALVAKLSQSKIVGSAAGTALNNFLTQLSKNSGVFMGKKAMAAWQILGIDPKQISSVLNQGDIFGVVSMLDQASSKLPSSLRKSALQQLFNVRGDRGLEALMDSLGASDPSKTVGGLYQDILKGVKGDIAMKQAKAMQEDVYSDIKFLKNALFELGISFVKAVTPMARIIFPLLTKGLKVIGAITESPIGMVIGSFIGIIAPLVAIKFALRALSLTIAMSLRTLGVQNALGGWESISGAAWNLAGMGLWKSGMKSLPAGVRMNTMGRLQVAAGNSIAFQGKNFGPGAFLPSAYAQSIGLTKNLAMGQNIGNALAAGSMAGTMGQAAGRGLGSIGASIAASGIGRLVGVGLRFLPYIGILYSIYEVVKMLWGNSEKKSDEQTDPIGSMIRHDYLAKMYGSYIDPNYDKFVKNFTKDQGRRPFQITLNNYMNGQMVNSQNINQVMDNDIAKDLHSNLFGN